MIPERAQLMLQHLEGMPCTLQRVGSDRSLFIGFGDIDQSTIVAHAKIEIGTYHSSWRVFHQMKIICGRDDLVDRISDLQEKLTGISLGSFESLTQLSDFDVRISFSSGICIDILCTNDLADEIMHVFFPENQVLTFAPREGWRFGKSNEPWPSHDK